MHIDRRRLVIKATKGLIFVIMLNWVTPYLAWSDYQAAIDAFDAGNALTALKEFQALADEKDARGQFGLGVMYDLGEGVLQNSEQAAKWYQLSAKQGYADAQNNLGAMYENGEGVPMNYDEAMKWYRKAAELGNKDAPNNIGAMYMTGIGVSRDFVKAHMWFSIAGQGDPEAVSNKKYILKRMVTEEIIRAETLAQEWLKIREKKKPVNSEE